MKSLTTLLDGKVRIQVLEGALQVHMGRSAQDMGELDAVRTRTEQMLAEHALAHVLFDVSKADRSPPEVRDAIWQWLSTSQIFQAVAFVVESEMLAVTINMKGVQTGVTMRAFADPDAARSWLTLKMGR